MHRVLHVRPDRHHRRCSFKLYLFLYVPFGFVLVVVAAITVTMEIVEGVGEIADEVGSCVFA